MLTLALEWPARGIELTKQEIDAAPILEAGGRSEQLWPLADPSDDTGGGWMQQYA